MMNGKGMQDAIMNAFFFYKGIGRRPVCRATSRDCDLVVVVVAEVVVV